MTTAVADFAQLPRVSRELDKASHILSHQLLLAEESLNRLKLEISATVRVDNCVPEDGVPDYPDYEEDKQIEELHYMKRHGSWSLVLTTYWTSDPEFTSETCFLREAARDQKLRAVKMLPELIAELILKASVTCDE